MTPSASAVVLDLFVVFLVAVVAPFSRSSVPNDRDALTREGIPLLVVVAVGALAGVEGARSMVGFTSKKDADDAGETR